jgi:hypothetical protein
LIRTESERLGRHFKSLVPEDLKRPSACQAWQNADVIAYRCQAIDRFTGNIGRGVRGYTTPPEGSAPAGEEDLTV